MNTLEHQSIISKYRSELMGVAILWVYFFHSKIYFPDGMIFLPFKFIKSSGIGGVDIFMFLSGFGLMHGMLKKSYTNFEFYKRRFIRIIPAYWIAVIISLLVKFYLGGEVTLLEFCLKMSSLWFWAGEGRFLWYVPAILALYLFFPVIYRVYSTSLNKTLTISIMILASYILCGIAVSQESHYFLVFLSRIPIFLLGIHIGYKDSNKIFAHRFSTKNHFVLLVMSLLLLVIIKMQISFQVRLHTGLLLYPFMIITYPLLYIVSYVLDCITNTKLFYNLGLIIKKTLFILGTYSLEIYLLHEHVVFPVGEYLLTDKFNQSLTFALLNKGRMLEYFVYLIVTVILASILNAVASKVSSKTLEWTRKTSVD